MKFRHAPRSIIDDNVHAVASQEQARDTFGTLQFVAQATRFFGRDRQDSLTKFLFEPWRACRRRATCPGASERPGGSARLRRGRRWMMRMATPSEYQVVENAPEVAARDRIDAVGRLVEQEHLGRMDQRAHEAELLLHAAGELARQAGRGTRSCRPLASKLRRAALALARGRRTGRRRSECSRRR